MNKLTKIDKDKEYGGPLIRLGNDKQMNILYKTTKHERIKIKCIHHKTISTVR